ncbi:MAG: hypothetical protein AAGU19_19030 [Prolixibacteraceae bacterium]
MKKNSILTILIFLSISFIGFAENLPDGVKVKKIWDQAEHNAFTDLIRFRNNYYCSFREGTGHVPGVDGKIRILKSSNGKRWESVALLESKGFDLRDAGLSVTPDGRLMVITGGSIYKEGKIMGRRPHVSFSNKAGTGFSAPEQVIIDPEIASWGDWTWRVTWHNGTGYTMNYQIGPLERKGPTALYLMKTKDGKTYEKVTKIDLDGFPNESVIRFDKKGEMYVMIRRELEDKMGVFARSKAPFTQWDFKKMSYRLGGPNFLFTDQEEIFAGTRLYVPEPYMGLLLGDKDGNFSEILKLPSGGDNSYPGLVLRKNKLFVTYYSSHEGRSSIYFAEIPLSCFKNKTVPVKKVQ